MGSEGVPVWRWRLPSLIRDVVSVGLGRVLCKGVCVYEPGVGGEVLVYIGM